FDGDSNDFRGPGAFSEQLAYDLAGNIAAVNRELGSFTYRYDSKNELLGASFESAHRNFFDEDRSSSEAILGRGFQYDLNGNRTSDTIAGVTQVLNNFLLSNTKTAFTADPDGFGNVASKRDRKTGETDAFVYRADKKLVQFTRFDGDRDRDENDVEVVSYFYDALGRRVAKVIHGKDDDDRAHDHHARPCSREHGFTQTFTYLGDQDKILLGKNGRGELTLYLDGVGIDEHLGELGPHGVRAYISDHLGTVINGEALGGRRAVGAYGEALEFQQGARGALDSSSDPAQYGFAGRSLDRESGLYYLRERYYDPSSGRFLQADPIGFESGDENLYRYVLNNPLQYTDPWGLAPTPPTVSPNPEFPIPAPNPTPTPTPTPTPAVPAPKEGHPDFIGPLPPLPWYERLPSLLPSLLRKFIRENFPTDPNDPSNKPMPAHKPEMNQHGDAGGSCPSA
ncbi:MAG: RHS repeat-associated core domain-containing protein, partial [Deltaproteobacteria bacterium]|nr:RHS repeat-associated core domain-containing protein [Deltaproteobacteria bacterium]